MQGLCCPTQASLKRGGITDVIDSRDREGPQGVGNIVGAMCKGHHHGREHLQSLPSKLRVLHKASEASGKT